MTPDDVRLTAQLVVDRRVHCVSDDAVEALARRVLELEASTQTPVKHALGIIDMAKAQEREACAKLCDAEAAHWFELQSIAKGNVDQGMAESFDGKRRAIIIVARAIRARGSR